MTWLTLSIVIFYVRIKCDMMIRKELKPKGYNCRKKNGRWLLKTLIPKWGIYERPIGRSITYFS